MSTTSDTTPLTNLQRELLQLFAREVSEEDLRQIRQLLARYFAEKAMDLADEVWEEKQWTDTDAERLAHTKMRTSNPSE